MPSISQYKIQQTVNSTTLASITLPLKLHDLMNQLLIISSPHLRTVTFIIQPFVQLISQHNQQLCDRLLEESKTLDL